MGGLKLFLDGPIMLTPLIFGSLYLLYPKVLNAKSNKRFLMGFGVMMAVFGLWTIGVLIYNSNYKLSKVYQYILLVQVLIQMIIFATYYLFSEKEVKIFR